MALTDAVEKSVRRIKFPILQAEHVLRHTSNQAARKSKTEKVGGQKMIYRVERDSEKVEQRMLNSKFIFDVEYLLVQHVSSSRVVGSVKKAVFHVYHSFQSLLKVLQPFLVQCTDWL